ncbi:MAG: sigma-70 family RNA polymerase sigma factor [Tannerella sp.]|jgi:RNA polymerase sigma-70 factor (ECF subfamily)|nr:sigma-70 family RNA polymerase sigma factor [Tannerella sp.]
MDEKQLIKGCIDGDRKAQKALFDKYSRKMMGVCLRYVKDTEDARDLMQEGFIKLFTNIRRYTGNGSFDGWVRKIFVNCALERLRQHDVLRDAGDLNEMNYMDIPDEAEVSTISSEELMSYMRLLPEGFRVVFNMYAVEGYSHKEIGEMLHISESTSRSQYMRARKMLQKMILKN